MPDQHPMTTPARETRRLSAIMFTDMAGYTAMVQEDEQKAKGFRDRHRTVLNEVVPEFGGTVLQHYGDGTLSTFPSAVQATRAAVRIQGELQTDPRIPVRIGLHVGDILEEEGGIFGDGVNIASRIQALGIPGSVLLSGRMYDDLRNQRDFSSVNLGLFELKNVRTPMEVYALSTPGLSVPTRRDLGSTPQKHLQTIAVLPFVNMSQDPENEFFSDGISEEIINALTRVDGLQVTARTSSFAFKGKNADIRTIGRELGVESLLEGSVRKAGERIRITAQLIKSEDGFHAWSEVYDRKLEDIFQIQDEISKAITQKLRLHFSAGREVTHSNNLEAYELYLKGWYHWNKFTPADSRRAIGLFQEAVKLDPTFALAYACQAFCYTYLGALGQLAPTRAFPVAKQLTAKAFSLQGAIVEGFLSEGLIALFFDWDWDAAGANIRRAIGISPGMAAAHHLYSIYLAVVGDVEQSVAESELAQKLDPRSALINYSLAEAYVVARRFHEALSQCRHTLLIDPSFRAAKNLHAWIQIMVGEPEAAITLLRETRKEIGDDLKGWTELGYAYGCAGRRTEAEGCLRKLELLNERDTDAELSLDFAMVYKGLGDRDAAFRYLHQAVDRKSGGLVFMKTHPDWDEYRSDPRFGEILRRIGLSG